MEFIDITPTVSEEMAVFPGDVAFKRKVSMDLKSGDHLTLSSIETTLHIGAHADAASHYEKDGKSISDRSLEHYLGACQVIHVDMAKGERIKIDDLKGQKIQAERVLFATGSYPNPNQWEENFNSLSPELIHYLSEQKVITVGIDTPSIDPAQSKALESHQAVSEKNMAVLEGIVLDQVEEGIYQLIALPLKLSGADASPVRAILIPL